MTEPRAHVHSGFGGEVQPGDIAPYVLLPTDASQVEKIVAHWDTARQVTHHYEFLIYSGEYAGIPITACSIGLGGMSVSIAIEELTRLGANTFLHIGIADPLEDEAKRGDLIIAKGAVRFDGASHDYARPEYPALAHFEVVMAAIAAAEQSELPYHVGVVASLASSGPRPPGRLGHFWEEHTSPLREALQRAGVYGGSGEEATLFVQAAVYGFRAGAITICSRTEMEEKFDPQLDETALAAGVEAMRILAEWDKVKAEKKSPHIVPDLGVGL